MSDALVQKWIEFAEGDLEGAEILCEHPRSDRSWQLAVYHCHEAVEKILKAVLVKQGKEVRKIHDLNGILKDTGIQFSSEMVDYAKQLNPHYHIPRYPDIPFKGKVFRYDRAVAEYHLQRTKNFLVWTIKNALT